MTAEVPNPGTLIPAIGVICLVAALVLVVIYCEAGCDRHEPRAPLATSPPCADAGLSAEECAGAYGAALSACSLGAHTLEQSIRCECDARRAFHRPLCSPDGGVP